MHHSRYFFYFLIACYACTVNSASGSLDTSYGNNNTGIVTPAIGLVKTCIPYSCRLETLALQQNGNILAGGSNFGALTTNFALACYLPSGALDPSFGTNGITLTPIGSNAEIKSIVIQADNKIVAAGISDNSAALARYLP